jgi:hypothetical protein
MAMAGSEKAVDFPITGRLFFLSAEVPDWTGFFVNVVVNCQAD